ncbi:MAG: hypothetical protein Q9181_005796 [Wetmoreana brouardii]
MTSQASLDYVLADLDPLVTRWADIPSHAPINSLKAFQRPSPTGPSPTGPSPTGPSPTGPSPTGPSPTGPSPTGPSRGLTLSSQETLQGRATMPKPLSIWGPRSPDDYARERAEVAKAKGGSVACKYPTTTAPASRPDGINRPTTHTATPFPSSAQQLPNVGIFHISTGLSSSSNEASGTTSRTLNTSPPSSSSAQCQREGQSLYPAQQDGKAALRDTWMQKPMSLLKQAIAQWGRWSDVRKSENERKEALQMMSDLQMILEERLMMEKGRK